MTLREALSLCSDLPRLDREVLLSHLLEKERSFLLAHDEIMLSVEQSKRYQTFLARAGKDEPIAYIIGEKEFYGRTFFVGPGVLIPRPESEIIVEHALENISSNIDAKKKHAVLDVGTGSGAIIVSTYLSLKPAHRKKIDWYALEKESVALRYARKNAKEHSVEQSIHFKKSDLLDTIEKKLSSYDEIFVIANLPYLSTSLYQSTATNVRKYEPKSALVSGADGLLHYKRLIRQLLHLRKHGTKIHFFFEISPEQAQPFSQWLLSKTISETLKIIPDLAGKNRIISGMLC